MRLLSCVVLGGVLAVATSAGAQDTPNQTDTEGARFLFEQGLELVEQQDWSRAADRFRSALRLRRSPAIEYNLAAALFELGQLNEAEELVVGVLSAADVPETVRPSAEELAPRIVAAGGRLTVEIDPPMEGVDVFLDDRRLPAERVGSVMTASLGGHLVEARRDHEVLARADVVVSQDQPAEVVLHVVDADATLEAAIIPTEGDGEQESPSLLSDWRFWAAVGGGAIVIAAVIIIVAVAAGGGGHEEPIAGNFEPGVLTWR